MKLAELRDLFWRDAQDLAEPHLFDGDDVDAWLNEAEAEAATRASLLHEADNADVCEIAVTADTAAYRLNPVILRVTRATFVPDGSIGCDTRTRQLRIVDREELDRTVPDWRERNELRAVIVQDAALRLGCAAGPAGLIRLEAYRLPIARMEGEEDEPEIAGAHHRQLVHWALSRGYGRPDNDLFDPKRAADEEARFERYFGPRPQADRLRGNENRPQFNKAWP